MAMFKKSNRVTMSYLNFELLEKNKSHATLYEKPGRLKSILKLRSLETSISKTFDTELNVTLLVRLTCQLHVNLSWNETTTIPCIRHTSQKN